MLMNLNVVSLILLLICEVVSSFIPSHHHQVAFSGTTPSLTTIHKASVVPLILDDTFSIPDTSEIMEEACKDAASKMKRIMVPVSSDVSPTQQVGISYIHWPSSSSSSSSSDYPPLFLIHGFDSSCLEYRRLGPELAARGIDTYAVDLLGWGFTQLDSRYVKTFSAQSKIQAMKSFIQTILNNRNDDSFLLAGASLGGASAIELAANNENNSNASCQGLILLDAQGFVDGVGPVASRLPLPLAWLGVQVLKSIPLRQAANQMSYCNTERFATDDACRIGRLHCLREGWTDALLSFMLSGGFAPSEKVSKVSVDTAILIWNNHKRRPTLFWVFINQYKKNEKKKKKNR